MRDQCVQAVSAALGRTITAVEAKDIESRMFTAAKLLAVRDRAAWSALSTAERTDKAAQLAGFQLLHEARKKAERATLAVSAQGRALAMLDAGKERGLRPANVVERMLRNFSDGKFSIQSVESLAKTIRNQAVGNMLSVFETTQPKFFGLIADAEGERHLQMELMGEDSGNADARGVVGTWKDGIGKLRERMNRAGGDIGVLEDYDRPHRWEQRAVAMAAGKGVDAGSPAHLRAFLADVLPRIDRERYVNPDGSLMNSAELENFLTHVWQNIGTGGATKRKPGQKGTASMRANRGSAHRQLHWKDAQAYIEMHQKYGEGSLFDAMMGHIKGIADDISMVETFGPNPDHLFQFLRDTIESESKLARPGDSGKVDKDLLKLDALYNFVAGRSAPIASQRLATAFDTVRNFIIASSLGSSPITSITDEATMHLTAQVMNMPSMRLIANELKALDPTNKVEKRMAMRAGLALNTYIDSLNRFGSDGLGAHWSRKMASASLRASGLLALTEARRRAWGTTMMGTLGALVTDTNALSDLDPQDHGFLLSHGISEQDWSIWKLAQQEDWGDGNNTQLTAQAIENIPDADIEAVIAGERNAIRADADAAIAELSGRNAQDQQWSQQRLARVNNLLTELQLKAEKLHAERTDAGTKLATVVEARIADLRARVEAAEVETDIGAYLAEAKTRDQMQSAIEGLGAGEDRRAGQTARAAVRAAADDSTALVDALDASAPERQRLDDLFGDTDATMGDIAGKRSVRRGVQSAQRAAKRDAQTTRAAEARTAAFEKGNARLQGIANRYGNRRGSLGETLGRKQGAAHRRVIEQEARARQAERDLDAGLKERLETLGGRGGRAITDLDEYLKRSALRQTRRDQVMQRIERDVDTSLESARLRAREQAVARLLGVVLDETDNAVVEPGAGLQAMMGANIQRGTWKGELVRSFFLFKSFPFAVVQRHLSRGWSYENKGGRAIYIASLVAATTVMGMVALQVNDLVSGKNPRAVVGKNSVRTWIQAMLKGGSLGIYGDFVFQDRSQYGRSLISDLMGPVAGRLTDVVGLTIDNAREVAEGKESNFGAELVRFVRGNTPGASLWYIKAALDHMIFNQVQEYTNAGYLRRMEDRARKQYGQTYYWRPGDALPDNAPDLSSLDGQ